jgi:hypothetical protein
MLGKLLVCGDVVEALLYRNGGGGKREKTERIMTEVTERRENVRLRGAL